MRPLKRTWQKLRTPFEFDWFCRLKRSCRGCGGYRGASLKGAVESGLMNNLLEGGTLCPALSTPAVFVFFPLEGSLTEGRLEERLSGRRFFKFEDDFYLFFLSNFCGAPCLRPATRLRSRDRPCSLSAATLHQWLQTPNALPPRLLLPFLSPASEHQANGHKSKFTFSYKKIK